jgi:hypothetical protein
LIASSDKIKSELGWQPEFQDLRVIIESTWLWLRNNLEGFNQLERRARQRTIVQAGTLALHSNASAECMV